MKRFSEQFKKKSETVKMTASERRELKERLVSYMEYHPLPSEMKVVTSHESLVSDAYTVLNISMTQLRGVFTMLTLFFIIVVPFAAEYTVPGDVLYPVKVKFNEEVRGSLTLSPYEKVEWETKRLERRLAEARLLASEGKLTDAVQAEVALAVKEHSDAAQAEIAVLRAENSEEAAIAEITYASALEVQSEVIETTIANETRTGASSSVLAIADAVATAKAQATVTETKVSHETLLARVELETTRAYELFATVRPNSTDAEQADIERRLADIERKVAMAIELQNPAIPEVTDEVAQLDVEEIVSASSSVASTSVAVSSTTPTVVVSEEVSRTPVTQNVVPKTADELLRLALRDTKKLITFMTDIEIKSHVTIEELIPVTPTDDESARTIDITTADITVRLEALQTKRITDEKFVRGVAQATDALTMILEAKEALAYEKAEAIISETTTLLTDLERMVVLLDDVQVVEVEPEIELETESGSTSESTIEEEIDESDVVPDAPPEDEAETASTTEAETEV